jgi:multimeric flavodoxin WrbA
LAEIAIVYFSGYGHTAKPAEAVREGVESVADAVANVYRIDEAGDLPLGAVEELGQADAIIYGSPTYMGGPAWQFKKFADASSKAWLRQEWKNKLAAGFTNSASVNGDKFSTIAYFWTLSQQHGQIWIGTGLLPANTKESGPADLNRRICRRACHITSGRFAGRSAAIGRFGNGKASWQACCRARRSAASVIAK